MESSEIWFSKDGEPEFNFYMDTEDVIAQYLIRDDQLTEECQTYFEANHGGYVDRNSKWVTSKGWTAGRGDSTYNWDPSYFWGDIFEFVTFTTDDGREGIVIMMHRGGDARGNYSYPVVYFGDAEEFISMQHPGDPKTEAAYLLGYDWDMDQLVADIKEYRNPTVEEEEGIEGAYRPQKDVKNPGQIKWTFSNPENPGETQVESRVQEWKTDGSVTGSETRTSTPTPEGSSEKSGEMDE